MILIEVLETSDPVISAAYGVLMRAQKRRRADLRLVKLFRAVTESNSHAFNVIKVAFSCVQHKSVSAKFSFLYANG